MPVSLIWMFLDCGGKLHTLRQELGHKPTTLEVRGYSDNHPVTVPTTPRPPSWYSMTAQLDLALSIRAWIALPHDRLHYLMIWIVA